MTNGTIARRLLTFRVERELYALDVLRVREVLRQAEIVPVPGAPEPVLGVINLRGSILPVLDARQRLGLPPAPADAGCRILVIETGRDAVGLRVDGVVDVTPVAGEESSAAPDVGVGPAADFLRGVVSRETDLGLVLDIDAFLAAGG